MIEAWRENDSDSLRPATTGTPKAVKKADFSATELAADARLAKQRKLARYLHAISIQRRDSLDSFSKKHAFYFFSVLDSDDAISAAVSVAAIANVASSEHIRKLLIEFDVVGRIKPVLPAMETSKAKVAMLYLLLNLSYEWGSEDKLFNLGFKFLKGMGERDIEHEAIIAMSTLNNLMNTIDRSLIGDLLMAFISTVNCSNIDHLYDIFTMTLNMSTFPSFHVKLLEMDVLDMIAQAAAAATAIGDVRAGRCFCKLLSNLSHTQEALDLAFLDDLLSIFLDMLSLKDTQSHTFLARALLLMADNDELGGNLCRSADLLLRVCALVRTLALDEHGAAAAAAAATDGADLRQSVLLDLLKFLLLSVQALVHDNDDIETEVSRTYKRFLLFHPLPLAPPRAADLSPPGYS
jgi:hypothetical protein